MRIARSLNAGGMPVNYNFYGVLPKSIGADQTFIYQINFWLIYYL
jgi:hypothetical protein